MDILSIIGEALSAGASSAATALAALALPALAFLALALIVKRGRVLAEARALRDEMATNLSLYLLEATLLLPMQVLALTGISALLAAQSVVLLPRGFWDAMPSAVTLLAVVFFGDFAGYVRHRIEHTALLWPAHAVHHSDTQMTWLTLERFHPINMWTTLLIDGLFLSLLGFPAWALVANQIVRHYYGYLIHADLPWTYGPLGKVFVSPVMHRWHHADDAKAFGTNFATVFSVFDRTFGTHYVPGPCDVPLGVSDPMGKGPVNQLVHPFRVWVRMLGNAAQRPLSAMRRQDASRG